MITRKLGSILRGKATPFQLVAACVLGALLGFAPGFLQAPALYLLLIGALLIVNANLGVALLTAAVMRIVSLLVVSVSFAIGQFLLDGPTAGLAGAIVNAPVLAWCGLEHYAVAGGELLGLVLGLVLGLLLAKGVTTLRRRMAEAEKEPKRWNELAAKPWARFFIWLLFGKKGKKSWEERLEKRVGNPVRIWGVALVVIVLVGGFIAQGTLAEPLARSGLQSGLEAANGATADVGGVELDLTSGRFAVTSLALADPNALGQNVFSAERLEADIDEADILRRRLHLAKVVISEAKSGAPRATPGVRTAPAPEEPEEKEEASEPGTYSMEEILAQYETWKERLTQARSWLDRLSGSDKGEEEAEEAYADRLRREVREQGWFSVTAGHLVNEAPSFLLSELVVDGLQASWMPGRVFDLRGQAISSHPGLVDAPPQLTLASRDGAVRFEVDLAPVSRGGGKGALRLHWTGLSVDEAMAQLKLPGGPPLQGGTLDLDIDGSWAEGRIGWIDLPLRVTIHDTVLSYQGLEQTPLDQLVLPIGLRGPIDAPSIQFDASAFADALAEAGKAELARRLRSELGGKAGEVLEGLGEKGGVELPGDLGEKAEEGAKGLLDAFGGKKKDG